MVRTRAENGAEKMMNRVCVNSWEVLLSDGVCVFVSAAAEVRVERSAGGERSAEKPAAGSPERY